MEEYSEQLLMRGTHEREVRRHDGHNLQARYESQTVHDHALWYAAPVDHLTKRDVLVVHASDLPQAAPLCTATVSLAQPCHPPQTQRALMQAVGQRAWGQPSCCVSSAKAGCCVHTAQQGELAHYLLSEALPVIQPKIFWLCFETHRTVWLMES